MKASRRKFEELAWALGLHSLAIRVYRVLATKRKSNTAGLREFYRTILKPGNLVFDIGANTGAYADVFESLGARVIAVEPNADCVRHIEITYPGRSIETILAAVGPKNGLLPINISDRFDDMSTVSAEWVEGDRERRGPEAERIWNRTAVVPCITLDTLIEAFGIPHYIKIDIEGYESTVLDGLSTQPPLLSVEFHSFDPRGALACLRKPVVGPASRFNITNEAGTQFEMASWTDREGIEQIVGELQTRDTYRDIYVKAADEQIPA